MRTRLATPADLPTLRTLIPESVRALSTAFYSKSVIESAIRYIFGVDTTLIDDGTYFVAESGSVICGCGGWSKRRTLFGGDQHKSEEDPLLDPRTDAARIRAFFVAPAFARHPTLRGLRLQRDSTCRAPAAERRAHPFRAHAPHTRDRRVTHGIYSSDHGYFVIAMTRCERFPLYGAER